MDLNREIPPNSPNFNIERLFVKTVHHKFTQFCIDTFSSEEIGKGVAKFYRENITFKYADKLAHNKELTLARIAHIQNLLAEFNEDSIINIVNFFIDKLEKGESVEIQSVYFYACVRNNYIDNNPSAERKIVKSRKLVKPITPTQAIVIKNIPIIVRKIPKQINTEISVASQFVYQCPTCGNKLITNLSKCSVCNTELDYETIDYSRYL